MWVNKTQKKTLKESQCISKKFLAYHPSYSIYKVAFYCQILIQ